MAQKHRIKITVIKKLSSKEVYGQSLPELVNDFPPYCDRLDVGKEFIVDESGAMPAGFCTWAWHDNIPPGSHRASVRGELHVDEERGDDLLLLQRWRPAGIFQA